MIPVNVVRELYAADDELYAETIRRAERADDTLRRSERAQGTLDASRKALEEARAAVDRRFNEVADGDGEPSDDARLRKLQKAARDAEDDYKSLAALKASDRLAERARGEREHARQAPADFDAKAAIARHLEEIAAVQAVLEPAYATFEAAVAEALKRFELLTGAFRAHPSEATRDSIASIVDRARMGITAVNIAKAGGRIELPEHLQHLDDEYVYRAPKVDGLVAAFPEQPDNPYADGGEPTTGLGLGTGRPLPLPASARRRAA